MSLKMQFLHFLQLIFLIELLNVYVEENKDLCYDE